MKRANGSAPLLCALAVTACSSTGYLGEPAQRPQKSGLLTGSNCSDNDTIAATAPCAAASRPFQPIAVSSDVYFVNRTTPAQQSRAFTISTKLLTEKRTEYARIVAKAAKRYRLEQALIYAVIHAESLFDHEAVSTAGAQGLMQLMPATATELGVADPFNPMQNIHGGARYLRLLLNQFKDRDLALAAYNAGPQAVIQFDYQIPPFKETQYYVAKVTDLYQRYSQQI